MLIVEMIFEELDREGLQYEFGNVDKGIIIRLRFGLENLVVDYGIIVPQDESFVSIRAFGVFHIDEGDEIDRASMISTLNTLNNIYQFIKWVLDDDGDVNAVIDIDTKSLYHSGTVTRLVVLANRAINMSYPLLDDSLFK